jgi:DNA topoisomerase-1
VEAYCVKCKEKREIQNPEPTFNANGTPATRGTCPVCGTSLYRMGRTVEHEGLVPPPVSANARKKNQQVKRKGKLVIVESPAKARTVGRMLGKDYRVKASVGHVRDLLKSQISVDVENDFLPKYRVPNEKRDIVKELKSEAARSVEVYLATDPDREGEAIAWHLLEAAEIEPDIARRVVFHEITRPAVEHAFEHPRRIDMHLVDAQQARRILDRLVGYNLSPLLWRKVRGRLSAGRVQSVALRLVVEREREIENFIPEEYWTIDAEFLQVEKPPAFQARLSKMDDEKPSLHSSEQIGPILDDLRKSEFHVEGVKRGKRARKPAAPFITSTLQQAASRRFGFTARRTMAIAQQLYEGLDTGDGSQFGLITYMRTDSTQVSEIAIQEARDLINNKFGAKFLPEHAPHYRTKAKGAQDAHEAIRPTSSWRTPESLKEMLTKDQYKLYDLIWRRFIASQMKPAIYDTLALVVKGKSADHGYEFRVSASSLRFPGFLRVYEDHKRDQEDGASQDRHDLASSLSTIPDLQSGDPLILQGLHPEQHFTQPPPRYSDASLVKTLEDNGIGRPSTYAPIISTLRRRGYVTREKRRLSPTEIGMTVNDLLVEHFPEVVDLGFTARMESELDDIADGARGWVEVVRDFYEPFSEELAKAAEAMPEVKAEPEPIDRLCPESGHQLVIRFGRFGRFIGCSDFPACRYTEPILDKIGVICPLDGGDLVERRTRNGRTFFGCANYPGCEFTSWKRPLSSSCPECGGMLVAENRTKARCLGCERIFERGEISEPDTELA